MVEGRGAALVDLWGITTEAAVAATGVDGTLEDPSVGMAGADSVPIIDLRRNDGTFLRDLPFKRDSSFFFAASALARALSSFSFRAASTLAFASASYFT
jgi:hypothetical protein